MVHLHTPTPSSYRSLRRGLLLLAGWLWSAVAMAQGSGSCTPPAANQLGTAGQTTTLSGGFTYSGSYRVLGDLVFTNGTYTLTPGTIFYVDGRASKRSILNSTVRRVSGGTITVGTNASLVLNGATLTAAGSSPTCPMWRGLVVYNNVQTPNTQYRLVVQNSTISHALCGIDMSVYDPNATPSVQNDRYLIENSTFAHNLTHIYDQTHHPSNQLSVIANCTFSSDPAQMHFPYDQTSPSDKFYTYQALLLTPLGNSTNSNYVLDVHDNTITQAIYGIVNNLSDRAGVQIHDNQLLDIYHTGIWVTDKISQPAPAIISGNRMFLSSAPGLQTEQIDPQATVYGMYMEPDLRSYTNSFEQNYIRGDGINQKPIVGMALANVADVSGNYFANLTEAIRSTAQDGVLFDNYIIECDKGIVLPDGGSSSYQTTISCNTFDVSPGSGFMITYGIEVQPNAYLFDQGSANGPAANRFDGNITEALHNDGPPFTYWYASSPQELPVVNTANPLSNVSFQPASPPGAGWLDYCSGQGATRGNGVNQRGALPSAATIAALADTVRLRRVPPARRLAYLYQVLSYYQNRNQLAALEAWWAMLLLPNAEDYRTVGLALLRAYDQQPAPVAAQRVLAALQPQALLNAELAAVLRYRLVRQHLLQTTSRLAAADSVVLRTLAWSGTSVAERAGQWLRYFHPRLPLPAPLARVAPLANRATPTKAAALGATLGVAYPNPAPAETRIPYQLPQAATSAELSFTDLLTGRVQLTVPLKTGRASETQTVQVPHLPAGQYLYRLLIDGQPAASPQRLVTLP